MKFPVLEMFVSIQGEGRFVGVPSLFVRLGGCNLRCVFGNSRCDTPYSSFELDKPICDNVESAIEMALSLLEKHPNVGHVVITGGEPMIHREALRLFLNSKVGDYHITIETNGSLLAMFPWEDPEGFIVGVDLWSVSPKLSTSVDWNLKYLTEEQKEHHNSIRIHIPNLVSYFNSRDAAIEEGCCQDAGIQLKFVYSGKDSIAEIKSIIKEIADVAGYSEDWVSGHVMLMPEGTTNEQLSAISQECAEACIQEGWAFCDRLHIRIWGDKRGV